MSASEIRYIDFGRPVLDFTVVDMQSILAILDGEWLPEGAEGSPPESTDNLNGPMTKALRIAAGQVCCSFVFSPRALIPTPLLKIVEDSETLKSLVDSLNLGSLLPGSFSPSPCHASIHFVTAI